MKNRLLKMLAFDLVGSLFLGISTVCFAVQADFAPGGVTGLAVLSNYLFKLPIGWMTLAINIPIILLTYKQLGKEFFLISFKSMFISSLFIDYVVVLLPAFTGNRLLASVFAGIFAGIAYSLFFNEGSTTGGTDFIIVAVKQKKPKLSFGLLAFVIDSTVIVVSVFVFKEFMSFVYGMVYTLVTSLALDACTFVLKRLKLTLI